MPWWLTVIIVIETLPMFLGPLFALNNPAFLGGPEATAVGFATWLYTARNFAVGIAFVVAYLLRNAPPLQPRVEVPQAEGALPSRQGAALERLDRRDEDDDLRAGGHGLRRRLPPEKCDYAIYFDTHQVADRPSRWPRLLAVWNGEQRDKTDGDICHWVLHTGDDRLTLSLEANDELYCD